MANTMCSSSNCYLMQSKTIFTIQDIVKCFASRRLSGLNDEFYYYMNIYYKEGFSKVIEIAAQAFTVGNKIHSHQRRIIKPAIDKAKIILPTLEYKLDTATSFENLYTIVYENLITTNGIGPLYIYDAALRIGAICGHYPKDIYLHCGSKVGAKYLGFRGCEIISRKILLNKHPAFAMLESYEIESCLCVCKNALLHIK